MKVQCFVVVHCTTSRFHEPITNFWCICLSLYVWSPHPNYYGCMVRMFVNNECGKFWFIEHQKFRNWNHLKLCVYSYGKIVILSELVWMRSVFNAVTYDQITCRFNLLYYVSRGEKNAIRCCCQRWLVPCRCCAVQRQVAVRVCRWLLYDIMVDIIVYVRIMNLWKIYFCNQCLLQNSKSISILCWHPGSGIYRAS